MRDSGARCVNASRLLVHRSVPPDTRPPAWLCVSAGLMFRQFDIYQWVGVSDM